MTAERSPGSVRAGTLAASWLAPQSHKAPPRPESPTLDIHVHLFGVGDSHSGCRISKSISRGPTFQALVELFGLRERAGTFDEAYVLALAGQLQCSSLKKGVVLAQDAVYDRHGKPDWARTPFYVPNDYLLHVVAANSRWMIPCVSINPARADALDELHRCAERGARLLKIHPPIQGVDLADTRHTAFFQRCEALRILVLVHTGHEHSAPIVDVALASPRRLALALEQGCTVVACHCGTGRTSDHPDMLPDFLDMVRRHQNLWGDTSVLGGVGRVKDFLRLLADQPVRERLLHGSDFPFPTAPLAFAERLGMDEAIRLQAIPNAIQQDFALKEALRIGRASAERAYRLVTGAGIGQDAGQETEQRFIGQP